MEPRVAAYQGRLVAPGVLGLVTQLLVGLEAVAQTVLTATTGTGSSIFKMVAEVDIWLFMAAGIAFLLWFSRCRHNAELLAPGRIAYPDGMAMGAWFVPGLMWWAPRRIALDIRRAAGGPGDTVLINAWWIAWLADSLGFVLYALIDPDGNPNGPLVLVLDVVAAALCVAVISRITAAQNAAAARAAAGGSSRGNS
ncbi:DUF4328 domain-containing protein [Kitasatospora sp. NPDC002227]|uniref:DUF4328 domain-containing protein n=1 Tax=Kitasatospora sp. NPDC002227 TaxID=3154773 RepID=UPI00332A3128